MKVLKVIGTVLIMMVCVQAIAEEATAQNVQGSVYVMAVNDDQAVQLSIERDRQKRELAELKAKHDKRIDMILEGK